MPRGASIVVYDGKRGRVWRIKWCDSTGRQTMETIGAERDGVTRKDAEKALRDRLVKVEQRGYVRPKPITFLGFAKRWFEQANSCAAGSRARCAHTATGSTT